MSSTLALPHSITPEQAWAVVSSRLPGARSVAVELDYHPFTAIVWRVEYSRRFPGARKVRTLVDNLGGSAFISPAWPHPDALDFEWAGKLDWSRIRISDSQARRTARHAAATSLMRRAKLGQTFTLFESDFCTPLWKPNWKVVARWKELSVSVLVDGLDGSHYVIDSSQLADSE